MGNLAAAGAARVVGRGGGTGSGGGFVPVRAASAVSSINFALDVPSSRSGAVRSTASSPAMARWPSSCCSTMIFGSLRPNFRSISPVSFGAGFFTGSSRARRSSSATFAADAAASTIGPGFIPGMAGNARPSPRRFEFSLRGVEPRGLYADDARVTTNSVTSTASGGDLGSGSAATMIWGTSGPTTRDNASDAASRAGLVSSFPVCTDNATSSAEAKISSRRNGESAAADAVAWRIAADWPSSTRKLSSILAAPWPTLATPHPVSRPSGLPETVARSVSAESQRSHAAALPAPPAPPAPTHAGERSISRTVHMLHCKV